MTEVRYMSLQNNIVQEKVVDVSRWNPFESYYEAYKAGLKYAIVKVNNAGNVPDTRFHEHMAGFKSAGTKVIGGYNYCYANNDEKARRASDSFVSIGLPQGIDFMWLDLEDSCMRGLGSKILNIINIYKETAESAGMGFGIYTGASFYNPCLKAYENELVGIPLWWARYPSTKDKLITDDIPNTRNLPTNVDLDGWQFTSKLKINGAKGYLDLSVWYEGNAFRNEFEMIPVEYNPFTEPSRNVSLGTMGNDANWVLWYLWRFGKITDVALINGIITADIVVLIKEVQALLGLTPDGIVGKKTRAVWRKIC